jgi:hypothetical protein
MKRHKLISTGITVAFVLAATAVAAPVRGMLHTHTSSARPAIILRSSVAFGIAPGTSRPVRLTASNTGSSDRAITIVRLLQVTADDAHPDCETDDLTMADVQQNATVRSGEHDYQLASGTLVYKDTDVNQDACQAATLTLTLSSTRE